MMPATIDSQISDILPKRVIEEGIGILLLVGQSMSLQFPSTVPSPEIGAYETLGLGLDAWNKTLSRTHVDVEQAFRRLASRLKKETSHHSASSQCIKHPAFKSISDLGMVAVPFILEDLPRMPSVWIVALKTITGQDPARKEATNTARTIQSWIKWGRANGFINATAEAP